MVKPGDVVLYKLSEMDVARIKEQRSVVVGRWSWNDVCVGEVLPLLAVKVWANEWGEGIPGINGQVMLDGPDSLWVTSVGPGEGLGQWKERE